MYKSTTIHKEHNLALFSKQRLIGPNYNFFSDYKRTKNHPVAFYEQGRKEDSEKTNITSIPILSMAAMRGLSSLHDDKKGQEHSDADITDYPSDINPNNIPVINTCHAAEPILKYESFFGVGCRGKSDDNQTHPLCLDQCGEDAYIITRNSSYTHFAVADGVGGWATSGINPALFSWNLMHQIKEVVEASKPEAGADPKELLHKAMQRMKKHRDETPGGSTCCLLSMDDNTGTLNAANLGDSGYLVIRNGKVVNKSKGQQYQFNAPFQFAMYPSWLPQRHGAIANSPDDADTYKIGLRHGDVIILGTDGLFDNMYDHEINSIVNRSLDKIYEKHPEANSDKYLPVITSTFRNSVESEMVNLAAQLTNEARRLAEMPKRMSPFARQANRAGLEFLGGKLDDITVLVSYVAVSEKRSML